MDFPAGLKYTKDHEWIKVDGNDAYIGITEFAQRELGDIVYIDITSKGKEVTKDEVFGTVEVVENRFGSIYAGCGNNYRSQPHA